MSINYADGPTGGRAAAPSAAGSLSVAESERLAKVLKAVADPVRLRLLSMIASHAGGEACVCDMSGAFELTGPTISHHLKVLRQAGLVAGERRGTWVYYRTVPEVLRDLSAALLPADRPLRTG
jgi:ArsR family transcriptional regulator, arsenate/arsenite/antimonite-responsive transcriptional repressor